MGNLSDVINKKLSQMGIARQVEAVGVVEKATEEIARYIPKEDFEVVSFNRGVLKIKTTSPSAAAEIKLMINQEFFKKNKIERVVFS